MNAGASVDTEKLIADAVDAAEDLPDLLAELVEKTATDPGAPFVPDALEALTALKQHERAAFEALRSELKQAGCPVSVLDEAMAEKNWTPSGRGPRQVNVLIGLAQSAQLFHTPDGAGFADLDINGHRETWPICSKGFRWWLDRRFFEEHGRCGKFGGPAIGAQPHRGEGAF